MYVCVGGGLRVKDEKKLFKLSILFGIGRQRKTFALTSINFRMTDVKLKIDVSVLECTIL